jgi:ribosomal protein S18 acetylase RimI-like enzyme
MPENPVITFRTKVREEDLAIVREIILSTGFFYDIEVPVAVELVQDQLELGQESDYHVIFADLNGRPVAYSCYGSIAGTEGSYDLYWIATHNDFRGKGIGKLLLEETERAVREMGGRLLIAETSMLPKYTPTRHFYEQSGYLDEARIADFYKPGDAKVYYIKRF